MSVHPGHFLHDAFHFSIGSSWIVILLEASTEDPGDGLPKMSRESTPVLFDQFKTGILGFPVDQFHEYPSLVDGKIGEWCGELFLEVFFPLTQVFFSLALIGYFGKVEVHFVDDRTGLLGIGIGDIHSIPQSCPFPVCPPLIGTHPSPDQDHVQCSIRHGIPTFDDDRNEKGIIGAFLPLRIRTEDSQ